MKAPESYLRGTIQRRHDRYGHRVVDIVCYCGEWVRGVTLDGLTKLCDNCGDQWGYQHVDLRLPRLVHTSKPQGVLL